MSQAGILEYTDVETDDEGDWIEIADDSVEPTAPESLILAAIAAAQAAVRRGESRLVQIDTDELPELDELDDAAIRAFFAEAE